MKSSDECGLFQYWNERYLNRAKYKTKWNMLYHVIKYDISYHILSLPIIIYDMTDISYRFPDMISLYYGIVSKTFKRQAYMSEL